MTFELPQDGDYHMIATKPFIDNEYVMHHILLYGCDETGMLLFLWIRDTLCYAMAGLFVFVSFSSK